MTLKVRDCTAADLVAVQEIYSFEVTNGLASFETQPPEQAEMLRRRRDILSKGLPFIVAELHGKVVGYSYASPYRHRAGYFPSIEDSVYVSPAARGQRIGRALLSNLIDRCELGDWRQMVAVIGNSANTGSIRLHLGLGFQEVGILKSIGFKHGIWVDTVILQRSLGKGDKTRPVMNGSLQTPHPETA
ncbi:MAG: N-acetyltransferase family protein [Pseudomonadota bacterium]